MQNREEKTVSDMMINANFDQTALIMALFALQIAQRDTITMGSKLGEAQRTFIAARNTETTEMLQAKTTEMLQAIRIAKRNFKFSRKITDALYKVVSSVRNEAETKTSQHENSISTVMRKLSISLKDLRIEIQSSSLPQAGESKNESAGARDQDQTPDVGQPEKAQRKNSR